MKKCPCCDFLTIDDSAEVITDICPVCFWQYDEIAQSKPDSIIGPNRVSLNTAKRNYQLLGASEKSVIDKVRLPYDEEFFTHM